MWFGVLRAHDRCMFLTPDTTAILVADRRRAFESAAQRRRNLLSNLRRTITTRPPAPARLPAGTVRTTVTGTPKAA